MKSDTPPPLHTLFTELLAWSLDRTADIPKAHRFSVGQRIDNLTLDALLLITRARWGSAQAKLKHLQDLNLQIDLLRVLWRIVNDRGWISRQQLQHIALKLDEAGRMTGGWIRALAARVPKRQTDAGS